MRAPPRFILASGSPRRRELLTAAGYVFDVISPAIEEAENAHLTIREVTLLNATRKALAVARRMKGRVALAADTLVALHGEVIGKPQNMEAARKMLRRLSGRAHHVCSAVCIARGKRILRSFTVLSEVRFRSLDAETINAYLRKIDPLDKAGAYAAQDDGGEIIERVGGSFTNVVGLPMEETNRALNELGIRPLGLGN